MKIRSNGFIVFVPKYELRSLMLDYLYTFLVSFLFLSAVCRQEKIMFWHLCLLGREKSNIECMLYKMNRYGIEGPVYLTGRGEKGSGEWHVDEQQQKIVKMENSNSNSLSYSVLQSVRIHMEVVEPQPNRPKLQLTLIT